VGTGTLVVVLGVMNGFQSGFIDSILEVDSHHVRVTLAAEDPFGPEPGLLADRLRSDPGVSAALPFADFETVALGSSGRAYPLRVKALPGDAGTLDPGLADRLGVDPGSVPASSPGGIVVGAELARQLDVLPGDEIRLLTVRASEADGVEASTVRVRVSEVFRSGYYAFDYGLGFVSFETARAFGGPVNLVLGVKLGDRFGDERFADRLSSRYGIPPDRIVTWRTYNRSFFGALRMEKTAMMLLVGLIFLVVAVNIFHSLRRTVFEKMEDIAVLKALGGSARTVRSIFVLDGLVTGFLGATCGLAAGLALTVNVNEVFAAAEALVNAVIRLGGALSRAGGSGEFQVFSPAYFYLVRIPARVVFEEILFIYGAGASSAAAAAWAASRRVLAFRPAEVLRNE
jgi:lipoprotein-releasing system permease protein